MKCSQIFCRCQDSSVSFYEYLIVRVIVLIVIVLMIMVVVVLIVFYDPNREKALVEYLIGEGKGQFWEEKLRKGE